MRSVVLGWLALLAVWFILKRCFICGGIHSGPADVHFRERALKKVSVLAKHDVSNPALVK